MESQINEVKSRTDIVALVSNYVSLKKAGRNYKGLCPFHSEKTGSFMVSPERQIFKCFGCSEGGDALTFYQKIEGVEFGEALKTLAGRAGVQLAEYNPSPAEKEKEKLLQITSLATDFYHYILTKHPSGKKALEYLTIRGINDKSISDWQLGFAPQSWDNTYKFLTKKGFSEKDIFTSSLCLPSTGRGAYDRFRSRIMFPIRNISGNVVGFSGRIFGDGEPKYLNSPDSLLFNKSNNLFGLDLAKAEIKKQNQAILVEGNLDAISSYQVGVKNIVAPLGTALTEKQIELLRRFAENLVVSFDQDQAGQAASLRVVEMAEKAGLNIKLTELNAKDPDELIKKSPESWKEVVDKASSIYDYSLNALTKRYGTESPEAIKKITKELVPLIARIDNQITRSHYERLLASKLGVSEDSIQTEIRKVSRKDFSVQVKEDTETVPKTETERAMLEKYLLTLILQGEILPKNITPADFEVRELRIILELFKKQEKQGKFSAKVVEKTIPEELMEIYNQISLNEVPDNILIEQEKMQKEINTCALRLKELNLRTELRKLSLALKQAEANKDSEKISKITSEFNNLSTRLAVVEKEKEN